jgi:hypothetical protein
VERRHARGLLRGARARLDPVPGEIVARRGAQIMVRRLRVAQTPRLSRGVPDRGRPPESRRALGGVDGALRPAGQTTHGIDGEGGERPAAPRDRWGLADAHYEALGRELLGGDEGTALS